MAKGRKTGGRKKGTRNKRTVAQMEMDASIDGDTPLAYLLAILRDKRQPQERRMWAAVAAAPFMHSKLKSIEYRGEEGGPIKRTVVLTWGDPDHSREERGIGDNGGPPLISS
jgi:hypothetical protein